MDWIDRYINSEMAYHKNFFNRIFDLSEFGKTLKDYGCLTVKNWERNLYAPHFLPKIDIKNYLPMPKKLLSQKKHSNFFRTINNQTTNDNENLFILEGISVLIDTRIKPNRDIDPAILIHLPYMEWSCDELVGKTIKRMKKNKDLNIEYLATCNLTGEMYDTNAATPIHSRFGMSHKQIEQIVYPALSKTPLFEGVKLIRSERCVEFLVIPRLFYDMPRRLDFMTNSCVIFDEYLKSPKLEDIYYEYKGDRLFGSGNRRYYFQKLNSFVWNIPIDNCSFRFLAVL